MGSVYKSSKSGSDVQVVTTHSTKPTSIALDVVSETAVVYWIDAFNNRFWKCDEDGRNVAYLLKLSSAHFIGLSYHGVSHFPANIPFKKNVALLQFGFQ